MPNVNTSFIPDSYYYTLPTYRSSSWLSTAPYICTQSKRDVQFSKLSTVSSRRSSVRTDISSRHLHRGASLTVCRSVIVFYLYDYYDYQVAGAKKEWYKLLYEGANPGRKFSPHRTQCHFSPSLLCFVPQLCQHLGYMPLHLPWNSSSCLCTVCHAQTSTSG